MSEEEKYILSFPRSGNHLTRFIVEFLTGRSTRGCIDSSVDKPICTWDFNSEDSPLAHVKGENLYKKSHGLYDFGCNEPEEFIFIVRDIRECVVRHCSGKSPELGKFDVEYYRKQIRQYLELPRIYTCRNIPKIVIYYEDLLEKPLEAIKQIYDFLGNNASEENYTKLIENYDQYKDLLAFGNKAQSFGKINSSFKTKYYFEKLSKENQEIFNNILNEFITDYNEDEVKLIERYL